jgi:cytochrome b561
MRLRNGEHGYGVVTKTLHWLTVAAITGQFAAGLTMEADDAAFDREGDRIDALEDSGEDAAKRQGEAAEERFENEIDRLEDELDAREDNYVGAAFDEPGVSLPEVHVVLGLSIMLLGVLRVLWRGTTPLPPWSEHLSPGERKFEAWLEKLLLTLLFAVPASGLALIAAGGDWLALHLAAQIVLLVAIVLHVGLVLKHTVMHRHGHLRRML